MTAASSARAIAPAPTAIMDKAARLRGPWPYLAARATFPTAWIFASGEYDGHSG